MGVVAKQSGSLLFRSISFSNLSVVILAWYEWGEDPGLDFNLIPEDATFRQRARWFRMCLQQFFKDQGVKAGKATLRPPSAKLMLHIGCVSCPAKPEKIALVEQWLCDQLQGRCISQGKALDGLPCAW